LGHRAVLVRRERSEVGSQPMSRGTVCCHKRRDRHPPLALSHEDSFASLACDFIATAHDTVPAYGNSDRTLLSAWTRIRKTST
jgi:hypothetical protein